MATKQPVKYDAAQHTVFAPGDTMPPGIAPQYVSGALEGDGTTANPLRVDPNARPPGPAGPAGPEGAFPAVADGGGLNWTYNPVGNTLSVVAVVSPDADNCLELRADGLFFLCPL